MYFNAPVGGKFWKKGKVYGGGEGADIPLPPCSQFRHRCNTLRGWRDLRSIKSGFRHVRISYKIAQSCMVYDIANSLRSFDNTEVQEHVYLQTVTVSVSARDIWLIHSIIFTILAFFKHIKCNLHVFFSFLFISFAISSGFLCAIQFSHGLFWFSHNFLQTDNFILWPNVHVWLPERFDVCIQSFYNRRQWWFFSLLSIRKQELYYRFPQTMNYKWDGACFVLWRTLLINR